MTFTEAAAQVLRLVGKPLHYKEITDVAIEKNLLSHVGKSPEVTMGARLAALVKKNDKENPLVRIKPGVFALREWDPQTIEKGLADRTPALEIAKNVTIDIASLPQSDKSDDEEDAALNSTPEPRVEEGEEPKPPADDEERARSQLRASATEIFEVEEDDDVPIFGQPEEEEDDDEGEEGAEPALGDREGGRQRRRRRRRRGGRGGEEPRSDDGLPSYTVSDAPSDIQIEAEPARDREAPPRDRPEHPERVERSARGDRPERSDRDRGGDRDRNRGDRDRDRNRGDRDRDRDDRGRDREFDRADRGDRADDGGRDLDELAGRPLADAVVSMLTNFDRNVGLVGVARLVENAQRRGRASGDFQQIQSQIMATVRADNLRRLAQGQRARFRIVGNRIALTDWAMEGDLLRIEREIASHVERYREVARRSLLRRFQDLPHRAMGELVLLMLERLGMTDIQTVRRPGSPGSELHLAAVTRGASGNVPTAIVVRRDGREIGRERVTELRGALHHYGPASAGWLITTGQVLSGAREEAAAQGAAPVTLLDGIGFARLCEEQGVAVLETRVSLPMPDLDLFEALRGG